MTQSQTSKYWAALDNKEYCKEQHEYIQTLTLKFLAHQTEREKRINILMEMVKDQEEKLHQEKKESSEKYQETIIEDYQRWKKKQ